MENYENNSVEIFAGTAWEVALVQSLLANAEIQTFLKDEINGRLVPWVIASGGAGSVKVIVSNLDYDKAKIIVEEYEKNKKKTDHNTR
jgi:hypothetical protein